MLKYGGLASYGGNSEPLELAQVLDKDIQAFGGIGLFGGAGYGGDDHEEKLEAQIDSTKQAFDDQVIATQDEFTSLLSTELKENVDRFNRFNDNSAAAAESAQTLLQVAIDSQIDAQTMEDDIRFADFLEFSDTKTDAYLA